MTEKTFEGALKRLEAIVKEMESGDLSLEKSLKVFEEGMNLADFCTKKLEEAEQKVTRLVKDGDGKYTQQPFEAKDAGEE
jgi:exodeoxyribonuclease VII small subunit